MKWNQNFLLKRVFILFPQKRISLKCNLRLFVQKQQFWKKAGVNTVMLLLSGLNINEHRSCWQHSKCLYKSIKLTTSMDWSTYNRYYFSQRLSVDAGSNNMGWLLRLLGEGEVAHFPVPMKQFSRVTKMDANVPIFATSIWGIKLFNILY